MKKKHTLSSFSKTCKSAFFALLSMLLYPATSTAFQFQKAYLPTEKLKQIDEDTWNRIGLDRLFEHPTPEPVTDQQQELPLTPANQTPANQTPANQTPANQTSANQTQQATPEPASTNCCLSTAKSTKKHNYEVVCWYLCPCLALFWALRYQEADYCEFCRELGEDCDAWNKALACCTSQDNTASSTGNSVNIDVNYGIESNQSSPIIQQPTGQLSDWLQNRQLAHALITGNPQLYTALTHTDKNSNELQDIKANCRPLTSYQIHLMTVLDHYGLTAVHIRGDNNCFRNALLPDNLRYNDLAIMELTRQLNDLLVLTQLLHNSPDEESSDRSLPELTEITQERHYLIFENLDIEDIAQIAENTRLTITAGFHDVSSSNQPQIHADISLADLVPAITGKPVLVFHSTGTSDEVSLYIVDTAGQRVNFGDRDFEILLPCTIPLIFNGVDHYFTAQPACRETSL